ncbi:hypothetical protein EVAR_45242_1 [Eumeta japonica]|uniref:Uncharacterized protein n=1 Tax=Eumeta variegata TaxID=151549 RepID=A0A4C1XFI8_EUMVA|nr:hypothetical protein EVAR_45242_1 [Eumeta japonica]
MFAYGGDPTSTPHQQLIFKSRRLRPARIKSHQRRAKRNALIKCANQSSLSRGRYLVKAGIRAAGRGLRSQLAGVQNLSTIAVHHELERRPARFDMRSIDARSKGQMEHSVKL